MPTKLAEAIRFFDGPGGPLRMRDEQKKRFRAFLESIVYNESSVGGVVSATGSIGVVIFNGATTQVALDANVLIDIIDIEDVAPITTTVGTTQGGTEIADAQTGSSRLIQTLVRSIVPMTIYFSGTTPTTTITLHKRL